MSDTIKDTEFKVGGDNPPRLIVNPLGEVFIDGVDAVGSINVTNLARELGKAPGEEPTPDEVQVAFQRELHNSDLTLAEVMLVNRIWTAQGLTEDGAIEARVGHWCGSLRCTVEARVFTDDADGLALLTAFDALAAQQGYEVSIMDEDKALDRYKPAGGEWTEGPEHGRPYRQIEVAALLPDSATGAEIMTAATKLAGEWSDIMETAPDKVFPSC